MALFISNEDVQAALESGRLVRNAIMDRIEEAYRDLSAGKAIYSPRRGVSVDVKPEAKHAGFLNERFVFGCMEGASERTGYFAIRLKLDVSYRFDDPITGTKTHEKYCMQPGTFCGLILLIDANTAEPLALMNDGVVQHLRVAATNALAAKYMARSDAQVLGLFGSGGMARSHASLMPLVRDIRKIKVYSPTRDHRERFASEVEDELGVQVEAVDRPDELARGCHIVACCTDSSVPVMLAKFVAPGMHLTSVTGSEIADQALERIDSVVLHQTVESSTVLTYTTAEGCSPNGAIRPAAHPPNAVFSGGAKLRGTLAELVTGRLPGRVGPDEVNYFYNNIGSGLQFAAIAGEVYQALRETGTGKEIPTEWLTQTIRD